MESASPLPVQPTLTNKILKNEVDEELAIRAYSPLVSSPMRYRAQTKKIEAL